MTKHKPVSFSLGKPWRPFAEMLYKECSKQVHQSYRNELIAVLNDRGDATLKSFRRIVNALGG